MYLEVAEVPDETAAGGICRSPSEEAQKDYDATSSIRRISIKVPKSTI
jgi:hypothetical protein